ncbi:MAG: anion permease [Acidobacteria bacterium]|nr:anion permease [Acidobacteriota bacterium]
MKPNVWKAAIPLTIGAVIVLLPAPEGLTQNAWYFFAVFVAVIVGLVLEPIPAAPIGFIGVAVATVLMLVEPTPGDSIRWALGGFSNSTVWLIFGAFMFAMGYEKTGLGRRIALVLVKSLGRNTLGLGYAITLSDVALAPFTPSNTARSGGTIFPIIRSIPVLYGSEPGETGRKIGSYIMWTALAATCVTSSMFLTGMAPNLLALDLVKKTVNLEISWTAWLVGFLPVGVILLVALPLLVYKLYPPEIKASEEVPQWASQELARMGPITMKEVTMAILAGVALVFWIFGRNFIDATTVALVVISLMLITGTARWDDILSNRQAWNVLAWFATLVTLAGGLAKVGFTEWFGARAAALFQGVSPGLLLVLLVATFFFTHYMFASLTAHTTAVLPVFLAAGAAVPGMNVLVLSLMLVYALGIMGILTPYATGPSPVYFGSGYIPRKDFWTLGLVFGAIFLAVFLIVGTPYLLAIQP